VPPTARDPRDVITPDAFRLEPSLLGTPLGQPSRRLFAILIDLAVVGILSAITSGFGALVWGAIALFLLFMAFRRPSADPSRLKSRALRFSTGCLGFFILVVVVLGAIATAASRGGEDGGPVIPDAARAEFETALRAVGGGIALLAAEDTAAARQGAVLLLETAAARGVGTTELRAAFDEFDLEGRPWAPWADTVKARALRQVEASMASAAKTEDGEGSDDEVQTGKLNQVADSAAPPEPLPALALDSIQRLISALELARDQRDASRDERSVLEQQLSERERSIGAVLADIWDEVASGFGLWTIYFTLVVTLTQGRTLGKRVMKLRVVRLDGRPLTWWSSFERAGGYAAGLATGLLGFAQLLWDPNRQCVQDKIGSTVVIDTRGR
jgi:uncharacterized RDD family membrane protein YckC